MKLKRKFQLAKDFSVKILISDMCASNIKIPKLTSRWKDRVLLQWLKYNYSSVIEKYKNQTNKTSKDSSKIIWSMWWQGDDKKILPEVINLCFSQIKKFSGSNSVKIITKENFHEYITLPEYIFEKVEKKVISLTHLSDIIRMYLLSKYGGLWLDSTVLITNYINEKIFEFDYFSINNGFDVNSRSVAQQRWATSLQASKKNCILCSFVLDMWLEYWKKQKSIVDYILLDYLIALAYENLTECKNLIDAIPTSNFQYDNYDKIKKILNSPYNSETYKKLTFDTNFFKLSYKEKFNKSILGHETLYGHLLKEANLN